jgi:hypothetical protein
MVHEKTEKEKGKEESRQAALLAGSYLLLGFRSRNIGNDVHKAVKINSNEMSFIIRRMHANCELEPGPFMHGHCGIQFPES